jgi:hypothetical protein
MTFRMDWTSFFNALPSLQAPLLPAPHWMRWGRRLGWGLVLATGGLWLGWRWPRHVQLGLGAVLGLACLVPGPWSPAYWLGLAFQAPSLTTVLLCVRWSVGQWGAGDRTRSEPAVPSATLHALVAAGIALGWLLLLDTFAVLPFSLYATGFSSAAVGLAGVMVCLPWVAQGSRQAAGGLSPLLIAVLLLYVLVRLPSGNLWDALLDPLLWLALHGFWLARGVRWLRGRRAAVATRA